MTKNTNKNKLLNVISNDNPPKYDSSLDDKHTRVVDRKLGNKDVNPLLKINYDGKNFKDTKGPRTYNLKPLNKGEKRGRFLFVMMDQYDKIPQWTFGPAFLAAVLEKNDYQVEIFDGTVYHLTTKDLEKFLLEREKFDFIGFGYLTNYVHDMIRHIQVCRSASPESKIILGGNGFSPLPAFYLAKTGADYGVSGEAEISLLNLVNALTAGESPENIPSVSFRDGQDIYVSDLREPVPDILEIPPPAYHLFPIESYVWYSPRGYHKGVKSFNFISSRGCPFRCNFCYRLEEGFRYRPFDQLMEEFLFLNERYGVSHFFMSDELFMTSKKHVIEFSNRLIEAMDSGALPRITWETTGRLNIVTPEVANSMAAAGCNRILYGLESGDTKVLELMNKKTSYEMIETGIEATINAGMEVNLPCMFGNIGETEQSVKKTVEILKKYSGTDERLLRPVTPYPGSPLYKYALEKGLLRDHEHFWEISKNPDLLTINFTEMDDETFYKILYKANVELIDSYHDRIREIKKQSFEKLYFQEDDSAFTIVDHRT
jgi:anaerobic magnesium-protoporphyrin IX monomethyl ester cyclase